MTEPYHIILSDDVAEELEEIFDYIARESPAGASRLIGQIRDEIERLKLFPLRQIVEGEENSVNPVRSLPAGNYMIFFRVFEQRRAVNILHVLHGARRRPGGFGK